MTRDEGYCQWDLTKLGFKLLFLVVDGENAIGHENYFLQLNLSHISMYSIYCTVYILPFTVLYIISVIIEYVSTDTIHYCTPVVYNSTLYTIIWFQRVNYIGFI